MSHRPRARDRRARDTAAKAVAVRFDGVRVASAVAGSAGKFSLAVTVPASALPGLHTVEAIGDASGSSARAPFRVRTDSLQGCFEAARSCFNPYENVIDQAGAGALAAAWRAAVGTDGRSAPVYANGQLFVGTEAGLVGLDPASGAVIINDRSGPVSAGQAKTAAEVPDPAAVKTLPTTSAPRMEPPGGRVSVKARRQPRPQPAQPDEIAAPLATHW
jgi:hypothetical protein